MKYAFKNKLLKGVNDLIMVFPCKSKSQEALPPWMKCIVVVKMLILELADFFSSFILGLLLISLAKIIIGQEQ